ncbi:MAG: hypothetical protein AAFR04_00435 [Pseudomonadota bacterium]
MFRSLAFLMLVASAALAGAVFVMAPGHPPEGYSSYMRAQGSDNRLVLFSMFAAGGLIAGLLIAWLANVSWFHYPRLFARWCYRQRGRFCWAMAGAFFASVLVFY